MPIIQLSPEITAKTISQALAEHPITTPFLPGDALGFARSDGMGGFLLEANAGIISNLLGDRPNTFITDLGNVTTTDSSITITTGGPGGCGQTLRFSAASDTIVFELIDNNGNLSLGAFAGSGSGFSGVFDLNLGVYAAQNYTSNESHNINVGNPGVSGDAHIVRVGTRGSGTQQQTRCFLTGGYGVTTLSGSKPLGMDSNGELCEAPLVAFPNNIYIANSPEGDDSTGDGSFSKPYATAFKTVSVIAAAVPTNDNWFAVYDMRTGFAIEDFKILPFVVWQGNKTLKLGADLSLHSLFGSITSDCSCYFGGYKEIDSDLTIDFSAFTIGNNITVNLFDVAKVTGQLLIIGHDQGIENFTVRMKGFETAGFNAGGDVIWQTDNHMSSGVSVYISHANSWQMTSVAKSTAVTGAANTILDVLYCGMGAFATSTQILDFINIGGNENQYMQIGVSAAKQSSILSLNINNDGTSTAIIYTDVTNYPYIASADSLTNITFQSGTYVDVSSLCILNPVNFTPTAITVSGQNYQPRLLITYLNGIDIKLGEIGGRTTRNVTGLNLKDIGNTQLNISVGNAWNDNLTSFVNTITTIPLDISTSGAGGLDVGSLAANTWYGTFIIWQRSNPTNYNGVFSLNHGIGSLPTIPAPFDAGRWIGNVKTDATPIFIPYSQNGSNNDRTNLWISADAGLQVLTSGSATSATAVSCANAASPDSRLLTGLQYILNLGTNVANTLNIFSPNDLSNSIYEIGPGVSNIVASTLKDTIPMVPLDSSHNFYYDLTASTGGANATLIVTGFIENI